MSARSLCAVATGDQRSGLFWNLRHLPTTRRHPYAWTRSGTRRHREQALRTIAFLQGTEMFRGEVLDCRDRERQRAELAARVRPAIEALLEDAEWSAAVTEPIPRQRASESTGATS